MIDRIGIDEALRCGRRGLRTRPGTLLLGSTGRRLWADYLDDRPGFEGRFDLIHKANLPLLFAVDVSSARRPPSPAEVEWRPSHLTTSQRYGGLEVTEQRFVGWDDTAVSLQRWHNPGAAAVPLRLRVDDWLDHAGEAAAGRHDLPNHDGLGVGLAVACSDPELWSGRELGPGQTFDVVIAAALDPTREPAVAPETIARATAAAALPAAELLERQRRDYQSWYDEAPSFRCDDPALERVWWYRWFLLRHNQAEPGHGLLGPGPVFYEGRSHKMAKDPWHPAGWEFSKLIPLSTPLQVLDLRWHGDPGLGAAAVASAASTIGADGQLHASTIGDTFADYANFLGAAAARYADLHGTDGIAASLPALKEQVRGDRDQRADADGLPVQVRHARTGKEYQPSYWYFSGYPDDPKDPAGYTPLKRVDRAIYAYLNARGVAELCRRLNDTDAAEFDHYAEQVAASVLGKQWDAESSFFYDLHPQTDQQALVRNVVGFYPWWAELTGAEHRDGLRKAFDPAYFGTGFPVPSVAADCEIHRPDGGWKGRYFKGRNGCMWNGPTWPYTNGIVIDALGEQWRIERDHAEDDHSGQDLVDLYNRLLRDYVSLHFHDHDGVTPYLVEHYDSRTGEPISDEPDYLHSYLIDLIVRQICGLRVGPDSVVVDPIDIGLDRFQLAGIRIAGHEIMIDFTRADGLRITVDGTLAATAPTLRPLTIPLPT